MDQTERAIRRLMLATEKIDGAYYLFARRRGAKENELTLLWALDDGQIHSQRQICHDWLIPKTTVNTNVKELAAAGYLELLPAADGREKQIALTPSGRAYAARVLRGIYAAERSAMRQTVRTFSEEFIGAMEAFADHLCAELGRRAEQDLPDNTEDAHLR